jgi:hypothetical protein
MKSIMIILAAVVTTVILFGVAILVGNIVLNVASEIYNRVKNN